MYELQINGKLKSFESAAELAEWMEMMRTPKTAKKSTKYHKTKQTLEQKVDRQLSKRRNTNAQDKKSQ